MLKMSIDENCPGLYGVRFVLLNHRHGLAGSADGRYRASSSSQLSSSSSSSGGAGGGKNYIQHERDFWPILVCVCNLAPALAPGWERRGGVFYHQSGEAVQGLYM